MEKFGVTFGHSERDMSERKRKGVMAVPPQPDHNSPEWSGARRLTHARQGSAEFERIDSTDAVWFALQRAARTGCVPVAIEDGVFWRPV